MYNVLPGSAFSASVTATGSAGYRNLTLANILGAPLGLTSTPAVGTAVTTPSSLTTVLNWQVRYRWGTSLGSVGRTIYVSPTRHLVLLS